MLTFQRMLQKLEQFWEQQGCLIHHGYDLEVGAGTFNPATFFRSLGPEPYKAFYIEPCRRPSDGRYGTNPNRIQHYFQCQVILKPSPENIQDLCLQSLEALGFDLKAHDIRFVHDDWESPTLGAWGLGWEIWMDGMEVTQFTYFQSVAGLNLKPITGEITYGLERLATYLQDVNSIFDIKYNDYLTYGDIYHRNEVEWSHYNFEKASVDMWQRQFQDYEKEVIRLIKEGLPIPAYDFVIKASHAFNILESRGVISVTERTGYIARIRDLACQVASSYLKNREQQGFPLLKKWPKEERVAAAEKAILHPSLLEATPEKTENFLMEIGSEELPASFVTIGCQNLEKAIRQILDNEGIPYSSVKTFGTSRRLAVYVENLAMAKPAQTLEKRGPSIGQAYDDEGKLKPAGEGFFRSLNLPAPTLNELRSGQSSHFSIQQVKGTDYIFATVHHPGKSTAAILSEQLPALILSLDFPKKMRWSDLDIAFARPIHWIVALYGQYVIPFSIGEIYSGKNSFGHRQLSPKTFTIANAQDYVSALKKHHVMVDIAERKQQILGQIDSLEQQLQAQIIAREQVLPQVVNMVEWPYLTYANFDETFLKAPKEVLISEMVEHQKYFPVANKDGSLKNLFIITGNVPASDTIRKGNQKAISPRLNDGVFLYEQGLKVPLEHYNEKLKHVTFQKELGSVYDKVQRISKNAAILQKHLWINSPQKVQRAASLCKADLATEMVFEFPELQGIIGRYYASAQKEDPEVAQAIEEHWMPRGEKTPLPESGTGIILSLADKIDNLLSCYSANLKPTSSSDPYALRRQSLGLIKIIIRGQYRLPYMEIFKECFKAFPQVPANQELILKEIETFIVNRVKTVFLDYDLNKDEIEAGLSFGFTDIYDAFCKVQALHDFRLNNPKFPLLFEVYKRAKGQINDQAPLPFSQKLLKENAEIELNHALNSTESHFEQAIKSHDYQQAYELIANIQPGLASLFDHVKILADDSSLRNNRIALLQRVFRLFSQLLDFSKIQVSG